MYTTLLLYHALSSNRLIVNFLLCSLPKLIYDTIWQDSTVFVIICEASFNGNDLTLSGSLFKRIHKKEMLTVLYTFSFKLAGLHVYPSCKVEFLCTCTVCNMCILNDFCF